MPPDGASAKRVLPLLLKIPTVAFELSTSVSGVYGLVEEKKLDLVKLGPKRSRITGASVERLLAQRDTPDADVPNLKQFRSVKQLP